ncbi:sacsin-like isoform X2 [Littorina saxatilis]|uniref:sacsin-like isoform X2 n=1 Tax=Littorina saxatilis TaxID=31220 RepID=UPI0038B4326D
MSVLNDFDDLKLTSLENIMEDIYKHLEQEPNDTLEQLRDVAIIIDRKKKAMYSPDQVVITILPEQIVEGLVTGAPETLGKYFDLFRRLGVCETVVLDHYAMALERLHSMSHGEVLNPNDLKVVAAAVHSLFSLLKRGDDKDSLSKPQLFLPGEDISMMTTEQIPQTRLIDSRHLILEVNYSQQRRLKKPIKELAVFVGFRRLDLKGHEFYQETVLLPEPYRMKEWHEVVREMPMESCKSLAKGDSETRIVADLLRSTQFAVVVKRLVQHQRVKKGQTFTEDDEKKIEKSLRELMVLKVTNLKTVLFYDGHELQNTTEDRQLFVMREAKDGDAASHGSVKKVTLYIDSRQQVGMDQGKHGKFMSFVHKAVQWAVGYEFPAVLDYCLSGDLSSATEKMDDAGIIPYSLTHSVTTSTAYPPPGSFVPEDMHIMLDQDVYEFKPSEYVAHELHDPILDTPGSDTDDTDNDTEDTDDDTDNTKGSDIGGSRPVYIFAKVKELKEPSVANYVRTRLLLLRYVIDVGEDEEPREVKASELYKFIRRTPTAVAPFTGDTTPPPAAFSQPGASDDLKAVLKDIRRQLRQLWSSMLDDKSRKRIVKRLFLRWHPDKNPDKREFCTKVVQGIQHYVSRGKGLFSRGNFPGSRFRRMDFRDGDSGGSSFDDFFTHLSSRAQAHYIWSESFSSNDRYERYDFWEPSASSCANPQPEEGERWLRQAEKDVEAARETLKRETAGFNWVCYMTRQATEKALKGVLYCRDASHDIQCSQSICAIASRVQDDTILALVSTLDNVVGVHTRMMYPGLGSDYPKIPFEVYSRKEAMESCECAEKVVLRARILVQEDEPQSQFDRQVPPESQQTVSDVDISD